MNYSVLNCDARYSISQQVVLSFMSSWVACFEGKTLAMCLDRSQAEEACRIHALCEEAREEFA